MNGVHDMEAAMERLKQGRLIMIRDDHSRENEGDLVVAASLATPGTLNFMIRNARGLVCQPITQEAADRLSLHPQAVRNTESHGTAFTVSVDAAQGVTTGISAHDRAATARLLADADTAPDDLVRPGHMFPLVARPGGVFERSGHTEASIDLVRLAGLPHSALICEILADDGTMARGAELERLAREWDTPLVSVAEIATYRRQIGDWNVTESGPAELPTQFGAFRVTVFHTDDRANHEAILLESSGDPPNSEDGPGAPFSVPLVRVHSECLTGDALHSARCDCGAQLEYAMQEVARHGGAIVYLRQEGRGIGLFEKVRAYALQDGGLDTVDANLALGHSADAREYSLAAHILKSRGYTRVRLLTNNPDKVRDLARAGVDVIDRVPIQVGETHANGDYLATKYERMGHIRTEPNTWPNLVHRGGLHNKTPNTKEEITT